MKTNLFSLKKSMHNVTEPFTALFKHTAFVLLFLLAAVGANAKYGTTGFTVKYVVVSPVQTGSLTYGTAGSVKYYILLGVTHGGPGAGTQTTFSLNWAGGVPAGVTFSPASAVILANGGQLVTLTISSTGATPAGTKDFTVTSSQNGVTSTCNASFIIGAGPLTVTASAGIIKCKGGTTTLTALATGGNGALKYSLDGTTYQAGNTFTVGKGSYTVTVKDADNFTVSANQVHISEPDALASAVLSVPDTRICFGQSKDIEASAAGGTAPYYYSLNGGTPQTSGIFTVFPGDYSVTITDAFGCATLTTNTVTLTQPATKLTASAAKLGDASITVTASGSFGGYTYSLNGGAYQPSNIFASSSPGINSIIVKDDAGCVARVKLNSLTATLAVVGDGSVCYGKKGEIKAKVSGGSKPFRYSLNGGTTYKTANSFNVPAGSYTVTVMDSAGYTVTTNSVTVIQPSVKLSMSAATTPVSCIGQTDGSITVSGADGFGSYTYSIGGGTYNVSNVFSGLAAGAYALSVKDANSCTYNKKVTLQVPLNTCSPLLGSSNVSSAAAAGMAGVVKITVSPNPSGNEFNLQITGGDSKKAVELKVRDMQGKIIYQTRGSVYDMYRFGRTFASGIYIAEVMNGNNVQRVKLAKGN